MAARSSSRPPTRRSRALKRSRTCWSQNLPAPAGAARRRSRPPRPRCEFLPCEARCHGRSGLRKGPRRAWSGLRSAVVGEDREGSPAVGELGDLLHAHARVRPERGGVVAPDEQDALAAWKLRPQRPGHPAPPPPPPPPLPPPRTTPLFY